MSMEPPQTPLPPAPTSTARSTRPLKSDPPIPVHDSDRPRTPQEAERFFRRVALENQPPSRTMRWLSIGGWVAGACKSIFACSRERLILRNCRKTLRCGTRRSTNCGSLTEVVRLRCILRYIISCSDTKFKCSFHVSACISHAT
jgi:hypothetical protein